MDDWWTMQSPQYDVTMTDACWAPEHPYGYEEAQPESHLDVPEQRLPGVKAYTRTRSLPPALWIRLRPIITKLYVDEERKLDDVRKIMKDHYGFDAT